MTRVSRLHQKSRYLRAFWRDTRVLIRQFRVSLLVFAMLICAGTLAFHSRYIHPDTGQGLSWGEALYTTFMLVFLEVQLPLPTDPGLRVLFFAIPICGVVVAAEGIIRFSVALFSRRQRKEAWELAIASTYRDHVVVCGLGRIGFMVVKELLRLGEDVVGIEKDPANPFLEETRDLNVPVLMGSARMRDMLEKARVQNASAIVVATEDDLSNLDIALEARELNPQIKVVLRMFDTKLAEKVRKGFGIHTTFSTSALAAPLFAASATRAQIDHSFYMGEHLLNVAHIGVEPDSDLVGYAVNRVEDTLDVSVLVLERDGSLDFHPPGDTEIRPGDCIAILAEREALMRLRALSTPRGSR
ncbi:MAG: TrkA family potassium uptake protein [Anaerolineae bacterium]|nr:TrkA family potassium uptake protein [Anaerolineae bacterium]